LPECERCKSNPINGDETILLVEDEISILDLTKSMIENFGYKVFRASTPIEAISIASESKNDIHLLITDVVMPDINGLELSRKILSLHPGLKCIFMSGYPQNTIHKHSGFDGGINFIQKPFSMKDIAFKIREVLDKK
jgi:DNA-binding NtrC family response regulator